MCSSDLYRNSDHGTGGIFSAVWFTHCSFSCDIIFPIKLQRLPFVGSVWILYQKPAQLLPERALPRTQHHYQQQHHGNSIHDNQEIIDLFSESACHMYSFLWERIFVNGLRKQLLTFHWDSAL